MSDDFDAKALAQSIVQERQEKQQDWPTYWAGQFGHEATVWMLLLQRDHEGSGVELSQWTYERARLAGHFAQIALDSKGPRGGDMLLSKADDSIASRMGMITISVPK